MIDERPSKNPGYGINLNVGFNEHFSPSIAQPTVAQRRAWESQQRGPLAAGVPGPVTRAVMAARKRNERTKAERTLLDLERALAE